MKIEHQRTDFEWTSGTEFAPDYDGFLANLRRQGTPRRVFVFEHGIDWQVQNAIAGRFGLWHSLPELPARELAARRSLEVHRFLGIELLRVFPPKGKLPIPTDGPWVHEGKGAITNWAEFEAFPWPDPAAVDLSEMEYLNRELPEQMRTFHVLNLWESVRDLMGFETICLAFYDQPDLVAAVFDKAAAFLEAVARSLCSFRCHGVVYLADDLGYKTSLMISPDLIREFILPRHKRLADIAHAQGKLFFFHSCGQVYSLLDDFLNYTGIDAKHSFEDAILPVTEAKRLYGDRLSLLGGMDVDFLARRGIGDIRQHTREILDVCVPGGGYCLGSGNWVTSYIPVQNYLAMINEGRRHRC